MVLSSEPVRAGEDCPSFPVMTTPDPNRRESPPRATGREFAEALDEVIRDQDKKAQARGRREGDSGGRKKPSPPRAWLTLLGASVLSLFLWLGSPAWLGPGPLPQAPPRVVEAGLRVEVHSQAMRLQGFLQREGRLPGALTELGPPPPGMGYERLSPREFRLWMESGEIRVDYSSSESLEAFLGDARRTIVGVR
jgi:hypothetical protein